MDWKIIGLSALANAAITVVLSLIYLPLLFLGPLVGGFLSSYLSHGFEDYADMDKKDGAVLGTISGIIGGLIVAIIFLLGFGAIGAMMELISSQIGGITGSTVITGYILFQIVIIMNLILGLIGGVVGVMVKENG
ncbi:MAG: DUF5518 domain-containing protein [Methanobacteriaceae archaeon]